MIRDAFRSIVLSVAALSLGIAAPAFGQTAQVGYIRADGSIQLFKNRLQQHFADGTPVAKIESSDVDGFPRLYRWAADGCRGESTLLQIGDPVSEGIRPVFIFESHPIELYTCEDRGCEAEFAEPGWYTAKCGPLGDYKCICVKKNLSGDVVIGILGDYCKRVFNVHFGWNLADWVLPQFIL
jgi:hypothetical protein